MLQPNRKQNSFTIKRGYATHEQKWLAVFMHGQITALGLEMLGFVA